MLTVIFKIYIGANAFVFSDENNIHQLFFQETQMCDIFDAYPELLCDDATYNLLDLWLPVYLTLCVD